MYSKSNLDCDEADLKGASSNYEALFDSGYNSNMQSKTFLDSESDLEPAQINKPDVEKAIGKISSQKNITTTQWSDSGVCITDSGLSINEEDSCESSQTESEIKSSSVERDLTKIWLKQNSQGDT